MRSHDPEEAIRHDVIVTIINAGKKDLNLVNDQLLGFVRERTLDKRVGRLLLNQLSVPDDGITPFAASYPGDLC